MGTDGPDNARRPHRQGCQGWKEARTRLAWWPFVLRLRPQEAAQSLP